jgi:hypothetical protein
LAFRPGTILSTSESASSLYRMPVPKEPIPDHADRVAGLAILDPTFAGTVDPDGVVVEITSYFPDIQCRLLNHGAVLGPGRRMNRLGRSRPRTPFEPIEISAETAT